MSELPDHNLADTYPLLKAEPSALRSLIDENLGDGERLSLFDLDCVHPPAGQTSQLTLPGPAGDEIVPHIDGVIIGKAKGRDYWRIAYSKSGGGTPPNCSSSDLITGVGDPGGLCATCEMNLPDSGESGGKACREIRNLIVAIAGRRMPIRVRVTPGSLAPLRRYLIGLSSRDLAYYEILTRISLSKCGSRVQYSAFQFRLQSELSSELVTQARKLRQAFGVLLGEPEPAEPERTEPEPTESQNQDSE